MELQKIRQSLLAQHDELRRLMTDIEASIARKSPIDVVSRKVATLSDAMEQHMRLEESRLGPILESIDAWGPERVQSMLAEHEEEHLALREGLTVRPGSEAALVAALEGIRAHMIKEEREMLREDLLKDDVVLVDAD